VIFGAFLVGFGGLMLVGGVAVVHARAFAGDAKAPWWLGVIFVPFGLVFLVPGAVTMVQAVQGMRGVRPRHARWERWAALLHRPFFDGRVACANCGTRHEPRRACPACGRPSARAR
jgi:hypothetical protein